MNWSLPQRETTLVTSAACSLLAFGKWLYFVLIWQQLISATPVFILTFSTVGSCCGLMSASNLPRCYCSPSDAAVTVESAFFSAVTRSQLRFLIQYSKVGRASKEPVETGHLQISGRALERCLICHRVMACLFETGSLCRPDGPQTGYASVSAYRVLELVGHQALF